MTMSDKIKVLLVEDDKFLSEMYVTKLESAGFEVEAAFDGEEALAKVKEFAPQLVFLDIVLPKKDGFEVLAALKEGGSLKNMKVIALTNLGQKEEVDKGLSLGASDYIVKAHFTPTEVVAKAKKVLGI